MIIVTFFVLIIMIIVIFLVLIIMIMFVIDWCWILIERATISSPTTGRMSGSRGAIPCAMRRSSLTVLLLVQQILHADDAC